MSRLKLDELFDKLAKSDDEWAEGASLYGVGGLFEAKRKAKLDECAKAIRDSKAGEKVTEACITEAAHCDSDYTAFLEYHRLKRADHLALDARRQLWRLQIVARVGEDDDADFQTGLGILVR